jgi:hypothetical protein
MKYPDVCPLGCVLLYSSMVRPQMYCIRSEAPRSVGLWQQALYDRQRQPEGGEIY